MKLQITCKTYIVRGDFSNDNKVWQELLYMIRKTHLTPLAFAYHHFYPQGFSGVAIIGESHVAIHTYPEEGQAYIVVAICGEAGKEFIQLWESILVMYYSKPWEVSA